MCTIKLNAIDSTNTYMRELANTKTIKDYMVVQAMNQTGGRGQRGTQWRSQAGKNLTISVFKDTHALYMEHPFSIGMVTALALIKSLEYFLIPKLKIKWPNDILADNKKICGILIENVIKQNKLTASIIGVGLNVNQTEFRNLPNASSLLLLTGLYYDIDELVYVFRKNLKACFNKFIKKKDYYGLKHNYENYLFRKDKPSTFKDCQGNLFTGIIKRVTNAGNLVVLQEDTIEKEYDMKELTLLY